MLLYIILTVLGLALLELAVIIREKRKILRQINQISLDLDHILSNNTDEKVMMFTDNKEICCLMEQINRTLEDCQKVKVGYRKLELNAKCMLSNISHDIKTPLTVIQGYLEIMMLDEKNNKKMLGKVFDKASQLMELIDRFFTMAKIEAGDIDLAMTKINLCEFCRENIIDFYEILTEKEFQVDIQIPEYDIYVFSNREALKRILSNLVTNAIRYGSEGKYLGLILREDKRKVWIDIVDKGKGIEKSELGRVFDRLYTMEDSRNRQMQGNGLGLTIAKELAKKLNGDIFIESEAYIRTAFIVELEKIEY